MILCVYVCVYVCVVHACVRALVYARKYIISPRACVHIHDTYDPLPSSD